MRRSLALLKVLFSAEFVEGRDVALPAFPVGVFEGVYLEEIGNNNNLTIRMNFTAPYLADIYVYANISWFSNSKPLNHSCEDAMYYLGLYGDMVFGSTQDCVWDMINAFNALLPAYNPLPLPMIVSWGLSSDFLATDEFYTMMSLRRPDLLETPYTSRPDQTKNFVAYSFRLPQEGIPGFTELNVVLKFTGLQTVDFFANISTEYPLALENISANCSSLAYWFGNLQTASDTRSVMVGLGG
jgi:hypothetical protein